MKEERKWAGIENISKYAKLASLVRRGVGSQQLGQFTARTMDGCWR